MVLLDPRWGRGSQRGSARGTTPPAWRGTAAATPAAHLLPLSPSSSLPTRSWNPADDLQAMGRVWREGQKKVRGGGQGDTSVCCWLGTAVQEPHHVPPFRLPTWAACPVLQDVFIYRLLTTGGAGQGRVGRGGVVQAAALSAALHMPVLPARGCPVHFCAATPCCARTPSTTSARQHRGEDLAAPAGQGGAVARSGGRQRRRAAHLLAVGRGWRRDCVCRGKSGGRGSSRPREEENAASDSRAHWAAAGAVAPSAAAHQLALLDPSALHSATPAAATSSRRCLRWTRRCSATRTLPSSAREGCGDRGESGGVAVARAAACRSPTGSSAAAVLTARC